MSAFKLYFFLGLTDHPKDQQTISRKIRKPKKNSEPPQSCPVRDNAQATPLCIHLASTGGTSKMPVTRKRSRGLIWPSREAGHDAKYGIIWHNTLPRRTAACTTMHLAGSFRFTCMDWTHPRNDDIDRQTAICVWLNILIVYIKVRWLYLDVLVLFRAIW